MKTYFISDLHLGAPYFTDTKKTERRVVSFLDSIKHDAEAIYLLGDVLDYWYEYRYVVPRGFVRFFGKLAELSDAGIKITWLIGNHDIWIFDYIPNEIGVRVIDGYLIDEIYGQKVFMAHGDGVGRQPVTFVSSAVCSALNSASSFIPPYIPGGQYLLLIHGAVTAALPVESRARIGIPCSLISRDSPAIILLGIRRSDISSSDIFMS